MSEALIGEAHGADVGDEHEGRSGEVDVEFGEGIGEAVLQIDGFLINRDRPEQESKDFGGNHTD